MSTQLHPLSQLSSTTANRRPTIALALAGAVTVFSWASAFVAIRWVGHHYAPGALALGRLLVGTIGLGALLLLRRRWVQPTGVEWVLVALCGLAWFAAYNVSLNAAEQRVNAGTAAMLVYVGPILIPLLAGFVLREGFPRWLLIGAAVACVGAVLIGVATAASSERPERWISASQFVKVLHTADFLGILLCLVAAATYALGVLVQKPVLRRLPALQLTWMACAIGAVGCLPFTSELVHTVAVAPVVATAWLLYLGVVPTSIAFTTWAYMLARTSAGRLGVAIYLVPPVTVALSASLLGELPPALALLGGVISIGGVAISRRS